jgi:hypothetical protein
MASTRRMGRARQAKEKESESYVSENDSAPYAEIDSVELRKLIEKRVNESRVSSSDVSFNELLDMYTNKELVITPEFQRTFRWTPIQQSRFIESLILELPIPPIFVVEIDDGQYELVDGLQRISTWLHFRGKLPERFLKGQDKPHPGYDDEEYTPATISPEELIDEEGNEDSDKSSEPSPALRLAGCEIVKELNGKIFDELPFAVQIALKRYFVRMHAVRRTSYRDLKYHMFKRLNQGGSPLSYQELRNCFIRIVNDDFIRFINKCSANQNFWTCVKSISQNSAEQLYHQELVLRFFAFKNYRSKYVHDIGPFLDKYLEGVSRVGDLQLAFDYNHELALFDKTFQVLAAASGDNTFRAYSPNTGTGAFRSLLYEAISIGIQDLLPHFDLKDAKHVGVLSMALENLKKDPEFRGLTTGGGKNTLPQLNNRIDKVREIMHTHFSPIFPLAPFKRTAPAKRAQQKQSKAKK